MSCERYRDALTDVAAGGPAPAGLEAHIASCESCREELAALRRALAIADGEMTRLAADEPSPGLAARIRQAVAERDAAPAWRFGWLWPMAAASATLLVALAVWVTRTPPPPAQVSVDTRPAPPREAPRPADGGQALSAGPGPSARRGSAVPPIGTQQVGLPRDGTPGVLVPGGEAAALERFAAELQHRTVAPDSFLLADLSAPLAEPKAIDIAPLEIVPLDPETSGTN